MSETYVNQHWNISQTEVCMQDDTYIGQKTCKKQCCVVCYKYLFMWSKYKRILEVFKSRVFKMVPVSTTFWHPHHCALLVCIRVGVCHQQYSLAEMTLCHFQIRLSKTMASLFSIPFWVSDLLLWGRPVATLWAALGKGPQREDRSLQPARGWALPTWVRLEEDS